MPKFKQELTRLGSAVAVAVALVLVTGPWVQGPTAVGLASFGGTAVSSVVADRMSRRAFSWGLALAQGVVCGIVAWLTLRWFRS